MLDLESWSKTKQIPARGVPEPMFLSEFQFCHQSVLRICYDDVLLIFVIIRKTKYFLNPYFYILYVHIKCYIKCLIYKQNFWKVANLLWKVANSSTLCASEYAHLCTGVPLAHECGWIGNFSWWIGNFSDFFL